MKAIVVRDFVPVESLRLDDFPDPVLQANEILIDVRAIEVGFPDILVVTGQYQVKPPLPFVPGKCAAGIVSVIGAGVRGFTVGDRVSAQVEYGAYAEKMKVRAEHAHALPDAVSFTAAASLGLTYQTAHFALAERARIERGNHVLVLGASGGIGVAAVQLAKVLGAKSVIAGVRGGKKTEFVRALGADHVIDLTMADLRDNMRDAVKQATGDHGADIVIDPVGGEVHSAAIRTLAWRGRMVIVGFAAGSIPAIKSNYLLLKNIEVSGLQWSDYRERSPLDVARVQAKIYALYAAGKVKSLVMCALPLADAGRALAMLRNGGAQGKIVLTID